MQAGKLYPDSHMIKYVTETVKAPIKAGIARYATYGT
jgi:hypothetical protein